MDDAGFRLAVAHRMDQNVELQIINNFDCPDHVVKKIIEDAFRAPYDLTYRDLFEGSKDPAKSFRILDSTPDNEANVVIDRVMLTANDLDLQPTPMGYLSKYTLVNCRIKADYKHFNPPHEYEYEIFDDVTCAIVERANAAASFFDRTLLGSN